MSDNEGVCRLPFVLNMEQATAVYDYIQKYRRVDIKTATRLYHLIQFHYSDIGDGGIIHLCDWLVDLAYDTGCRVGWPKFLPPHREIWQSCSQLDYM